MRLFRRKEKDDETQVEERPETQQDETPQHEVPEQYLREPSASPEEERIWSPPVEPVQDEALEEEAVEPDGEPAEPFIEAMVIVEETAMPVVEEPEPQIEEGVEESPAPVIELPRPAIETPRSPQPPVRAPAASYSNEERVPAIVVALVNQKGGVGKTTTAINLGAELAVRGVATLLVDIDPQANSTAGLGLSNSNRTSIYEVLLEESQLEDVIIDTPQEGLQIAPSGPDLAGAEVELVPLMAREQRLLRALGTVAMRYDAVIIDCPPSLGLLTLNALTASDEVLVPVQCEYLALEGLGQLVRTLDAVRRNLNPALHLGGLVLTMFDSRTNLCQQVASEVRAHFPTTFDTVIPRSVRASEAPSHGLPIGQYAPGVAVHKSYEALAEEFIAKLLPHRARAGVMP